MPEPDERFRQATTTFAVGFISGVLFILWVLSHGPH